MKRSEASKVIVMTGGTSGFGARTLARFSALTDTQVMVGARGRERDVPTGVDVLPLDLASLASVRGFAGMVVERMAGRKIDILELNAGLHGSAADERSAEGYGLTFAVNHLAHYLLVQLLLPAMADGGRVVITSSNMHDPPFKRLAPQGLLLQEWADPSPGGPGTGVRSYCASKLCNLMTAAYLAGREEVRARAISVVAFNPGLTGSASGRDASRLQKALVSALTHTLFPLVGLFRPEFVMNSAEHSGRMLADVALGTVRPPPGQVYVSLVKGRPTFPDPSALARDFATQERLWRESAMMVSLAEGDVVK